MWPVGMYATTACYACHVQRSKEASLKRCCARLHYCQMVLERGKLTPKALQAFLQTENPSLLQHIQVQRTC
jgi:hypothetical protein